MTTCGRVKQQIRTMVRRHIALTQVPPPTTVPIARPSAVGIDLRHESRRANVKGVA
jgi:hypothetical protein